MALPRPSRSTTAIVTGASSGLGVHFATELAALGHHVTIVARREEPMVALAAEIKKGGAPEPVLIVVADLATKSGRKHLWTQLEGARRTPSVLINNAGILRDQSFTKMNLDDFRLVMEVHLMGAVICTKAVWDIMRAQNYGRIVMTTSSSGLFGNFGQSNYGAAKMALVGLMQTLSIEGAKHDIRVNCLAPTAATQMTQGLWPDQVLKAFRPEFVTPAVVVLAAQDAPNRTILCAGAGTFEAAHITMTGGAWVGNDEQTAEHLRERLTEVTDRTGSVVPKSAEAQGVNEGTKALAAIGDTNE